MTQRENKFLIALIVVFFICGAALVVLKLIGDNLRQKNYEYTQAFLQQLQQQRKPVGCEKLPTEILGSSTFKDWASGKGIAAAIFCGSAPQPIKVESHTGFTTQAECQNAISQSQGAGKYIESPDGAQAVCMGGFGEPDSYVYLMHLPTAQSQTLKSCGTPCKYENGFWLDNERFALLETDEINPGETNHLAQLFDFKNQTTQIWQANPQSSWKTYRNDEYGFEFEYPAELLKSEELGIPIVCGTEESVGLDKFNQPIFDKVCFSVTYDATTKYKDTAEALSDVMLAISADSNQSSWHYSSPELININGTSFYWFDWVHQIYGEDFITVHNKTLFKVEISSGDAMKNLKDFKAYSTLREITSTFKFTK